MDVLYKGFLFVALGAMCYIVFTAGSKKIKPSKTTLKLINEYKKIEKEKNTSAVIKSKLAWFDNLMSSNSYLSAMVDNLTRKLMVISYDDDETCRQKIIVKFFYLFCIIVVEAVVMLLIVPSWYVTLSVCGVTAFMYYQNMKNSLEKKVQNLYLQLPEALQSFLDNYVVTQNVKSSLDAVPHSMKGDICVVFEKLSRRLSSGEDAKASIDAFADDLDYFWAYAFAELLGIALTTSGDIRDDIQFLINIINDSIEEKMDVKAQLSGSKNIVNGINLFALLAAIIEFIAMPFARNLYLYTSTGNMIILLFILEVIGTNIIFTLMEDF